MNASEELHIKCMKMLLEGGAQVNIKDKVGSVLLHTEYMQ